MRDNQLVSARGEVEIAMQIERESVCVRDGERIIPEAIVFPRNNRVLFISLGE